MSTLRATLRSPFVPVLLLFVVVGLDAIAASRRWHVLAAGLLDEPAHLATAALVLLAVAGPRWLALHRGFTIAACLASVAIDVDHIPLYARIPHIAVDGGRPFTHSLLTVAVLLLVALTVRRSRPVALGLAAGVALHLFRDLASGPGVSLFWPLDAAGLHLPYAVYVSMLVVVTAIATVRSATDRRPRRPAHSTVAADVNSSAATDAG